MKELMLILLNALLIVIIIAVYVRLHMVIKQQGFQISVLLKHEKEAFKEGMSPAMRIVRARQMKDQTNYLLPSDKQAAYTSDADATFNVPYRGSDLGHILPKKAAEPVKVEEPKKVEEVIPVDVAAKVGAGTLQDVKIDSTGEIPMTNTLPVEKQSGVATADVSAEAFSVNGRANAGIALGGGRLTAPHKFKTRE